MCDYNFNTLKLDISCLTFYPWLFESEVLWVFDEFLVVGSYVENTGQDALWVETTGSNIQVKLANLKSIPNKS